MSENNNTAGFRVVFGMSESINVQLLTELAWNKQIGLTLDDVGLSNKHKARRF
ncbi:MAG: hypothetical protein HW407_2274 [Bacteroidetes bacterium]|nr:hypothetical protein [Bacteroidota bacterium]